MHPSVRLRAAQRKLFKARNFLKPEVHFAVDSLAWRVRIKTSDYDNRSQALLYGERLKSAAAPAASPEARVAEEANAASAARGKVPR